MQAHTHMHAHTHTQAHNLCVPVMKLLVLIFVASCLEFNRENWKEYCLVGSQYKDTGPYCLHMEF